MIKYLKTLVSLLADVLLDLPGLGERDDVVLAVLHTGGTAGRAVAVLVVADINPAGGQGEAEAGGQHQHGQRRHLLHDWAVGLRR